MEEKPNMSAKPLCQDNTFTYFNNSIANIILTNLVLSIIKFRWDIFMEVDAKLEEKLNISTKLLSRQISH